MNEFGAVTRGSPEYECRRGWATRRPDDTAFGRCWLTARLLLVDHADDQLLAVGADLGHVHGVADERQGVELSRNLGAQVVTDLPESFGKLVDEQSTTWSGHRRTGSWPWSVLP